MHSPGGADGPTISKEASGGQNHACWRTTRNGNSPGRVHKTQQLNKIQYGDILGFVITWAHTQPPAQRGRAGLAPHLGHIPDASKQNSLVQETSLQHSQRARYNIQSLAKQSVQQRELEIKTKSQVSNEHLFVMQQAQGNPHPFTAPPVHIPHLSPCPSFLEEDGLKSEDTATFPASATAQQPPERQQRTKQKEMSFSLPQYSLPASPAASHSTPGPIQSTHCLSQTPLGSGSNPQLPPQGVLNGRSNPSTFLHRQIQIQMNTQSQAPHPVLVWHPSVRGTVWAQAALAALLMPWVKSPQPWSSWSENVPSPHWPEGACRRLSGQKTRTWAKENENQMTVKHRKMGRRETWDAWLTFYSLHLSLLSPKPFNMATNHLWPTPKLPRAVGILSLGLQGSGSQGSS